MEQDCSWAGMLQIFQFCQNQSFPWERTGFLGIFFFKLELSNEFFWFWLWLNNLLHWNLAAEFSVAALVVAQDKSSGPCYLPMPLFPVQTPWAAHDPHSSSISWRCLLEKEQMLQLGPKQGIPLGEQLDPALPWGRRLRQRATSQKAQQDFSLPKILHVPLQVWAGLKKNLGLWLESDGWFEAHSLENDD